MTDRLGCPDCGAVYPPGPTEPFRCECGHPLEIDATAVPEGASRVPFSKLDSRRGMWAFFEFIPVEPRVTLGEGFTPLLDAPDWDAEFKLEYVNPTGSFKDRGAATVVSRALGVGADRVLEDSSGNAGAAVATYAARAGIDADIYVPAGTSSSKLLAIQRTGARPVRVEGDRPAVAEACVEAAEAGEGWYASHAWRPSFLAGTATFAYEVAAQRDWSVPDAVVVPTGHGTLLLGAYRGFAALKRAGLTDEVPTLFAGQAAGYDPIAQAFSGSVGTGLAPPDADAAPDADVDADRRADPRVGPDGESAAADGGDGPAGLDLDIDLGEGEARPGAGEGPNEVADAIQIADPARREQIVEAIWATGGDAVALDADAVELALDELHRAGFYTEPTCAVGPAALEQFREDGAIAADDDVVVPLTGTGYKTM